MAIILRLDRMMADRKMSLNELAEKVGISNVNLSKIKTGKVSGVRFTTVDGICKALDCQPGDILEYKKDEVERVIKHYAKQQKIKCELERDKPFIM